MVGVEALNFQNVIDYYDRWKNVYRAIGVFVFLSLPDAIQNVLPHEILDIVDSRIRYFLTYAAIFYILVIAILEVVLWKSMKRTALIFHTSMSGVRESELPDSLEGKRYKKFVISLEPGKVDDWAEVLRVQRDKVAEIMTKLEGYSVVYYAGIAHIPLIIDLGYQFSDRQKFRYLHYHRDRGERPWEWPERTIENEWEIKYPRKKVSANVRSINLLIEYSHKISESDIAGMDLPDDILRIGLKSPSIYDLNSEEKVNRFERRFRDIMDKLRNVDSVHLFAAVPPPIAFVIGRNISETMHPKIYVYYYERSSKPRYILTHTLNEK